jgi:hypothetical protein
VYRHGEGLNAAARRAESGAEGRRAGLRDASACALRVEGPAVVRACARMRGRGFIRLKSSTVVGAWEGEGRDERSLK